METGLIILLFVLEGAWSILLGNFAWGVMEKGHRTGKYGHFILAKLLLMAGMLYVFYDRTEVYHIVPYVASMLGIFAIMSVFNPGCVRMNLYLSLWECFTLVVSRGVAVSAYAICSRSSFTQLYSSPVERCLIEILGVCLAMAAVWIWGKKQKELFPELPGRKLSYTLLTGLMGGICLVLAEAKEMSHVEGDVFQYGIAFQALCCMAWVIYSAVFHYAYGGILQLRKFRSREELLQNQARIQEKNYCAQAEYIERVRRFKHDYVSQMRGLSFLLEEGDFDRIRQYVKSLQADMEAAERGYRQYSNVPLLDAVLRDTVSEYKRQGIRCEANVRLAGDVPVGKMDMSLLFADCLSVTRTAAFLGKQTEGVRISCHEKDHWTVMEFLCRFERLDGMLFGRDGICRSQENAIRTIMEKYGGFVFLEQKPGYCNILAALQKEENKDGSTD